MLREPHLMRKPFKFAIIYAKLTDTEDLGRGLTCIYKAK